MVCPSADIKGISVLFTKKGNATSAFDPNETLTTLAVEPPKSFAAAINLLILTASMPPLELG
jgi:hypothetical protein